MFVAFVAVALMVQSEGSPAAPPSVAFRGSVFVAVALTVQSEGSLAAPSGPVAFRRKRVRWGYTTVSRNTAFRSLWSACEFPH